MTTKDLFGRETSPPHPGEVLREDILPHYTLTRGQLAKHLQISTRVLNEFVRERRDINLDLAMRLGEAFGQGAHFWLGLQMQHDLWQARHREPSVRPIRRKGWPGMRPSSAPRALQGPVAAI
jgi:antitoxin HigA-1